jgi:hypothetical protein
MAINGVPATATTGTGATMTGFGSTGAKTGPAELIGAATIEAPEAPEAPEAKTGATEP